MESRTTTDKMVQQWAKITIDRMQRKIKIMKIGTTSPSWSHGLQNKLYNSLVSSIIYSSNGEPEKVKLMYNYYGAMVDMGVGSGYRSNSLKERFHFNKLITHKGRRPKKWYSKTMYAEVIELADLMMQQVGDRSIPVITEGLPNKIIL